MPVCLPAPLLARGMPRAAIWGRASAQARGNTLCTSRAASLHISGQTVGRVIGNGNGSLADGQIHVTTRWDAQRAGAHVASRRGADPAVADGVKVVTDYPAALPRGTTILLGMKPYQIAEVAAALAPLCTADTPIISILAGTTLNELRTRFAAATDIVRAMPNLPVGLGQGVVALFTDDRTSPAARSATRRCRRRRSSRMATVATCAASRDRLR